MTSHDIPEALTDPRIYPDKSVKIELNCVCGAVLEAATYLDHGLIKLVIEPCRCGGRGLK